MKHFSGSAALLAAVSAFSSAVPEPARAEPTVETLQLQAAPPIQILAYDFVGSGCPEGTLNVFPGNSDAKGQAITVTMDNYEAKVDTSKANALLDCELRLRLRAPRGMRTALSTIKYDGLANLQAGVTGKLDAYYTWRGQPIEAQSQTPMVLTGPYNDQFTFLDRVDVTQWSACDTEEVFVLQTFLSVINNAQPRRLGSMRVSQSEIDIQSQVSRSVIIDFLLGPCPAK